MYVSSDGPEIVEFDTIPANGSIIESNTTTFTCSIDTRPGANIHLSGPMGVDVSESNVTELVHSITNITGNHSGAYTCLSINYYTGIQVDETKNIQVKCELLLI